MIAAVAAAAVTTEPRDARMLVATDAGIVAVAPDGTRRTLIADAQDAAYSPDGTFVAFARDGDIWLANSDGSGQRRLTATPNVQEWGPSWLRNGRAIVYTARAGDARQIRVLLLPTGSSTRIASSGAEEYSAAISDTGRLAFVSTRSGSPAVYVAQANGTGATLYDTTPPATPFARIYDLAWSPDGTKLAYTADDGSGTTSVVLDDGTTQTTLAEGIRPVWSPAATRIAFQSETGLASVAPDGADLRTLGAGTPLDWRVVPVGAPRYPNLVQRPPSGLVVTRSARGHWLLGFTSMVDNRGPGILWITARRLGSEDVMQVSQRVQLAGGGARVLAQSGELRYVVAPPHYHWHFLGFDRYELHRATDFVLLVRDHKSGFCIADHYGIALGIPHGPPRFLGNCAQFDPRARSVEEGSSVGYTDRYPAYFHGQDIDITRVPPGRYWLVHRVNSEFHLRETRYDDDAASLLVRITWRNGAPTVAPLRTCLRERC